MNKFQGGSQRKTQISRREKTYFAPLANSSILEGRLTLQSLLCEGHFKLAKVLVICCDNLSTVMLAANSILNAKTKDIGATSIFCQRINFAETDRCASCALC